MMFSFLQCLLHPRSAVPHPCPGTQHSGSFYSWYNHPASWQSWSTDLESNIYTNKDLDIYVCVLVFLIKRPLVQEFKAQKCQMQAHMTIFMSWLLSRMLKLVKMSLQACCPLPSPLPEKGLLWHIPLVLPSAPQVISKPQVQGKTVCREGTGGSGHVPNCRNKANSQKPWAREEESINL